MNATYLLPPLVIGAVLLTAFTHGYAGRARADAEQDAATLAANKAIARRFFAEVLSKGDQVAAAELVAPSAVFHLAVGDLDVAAVGEVLTVFFTGFPDLAFTVEDLVAEGDQVAVRWTFTGTHTGPFMGVPPTGRQVRMAGISLLRIEGGRIVEDWVVDDLLGLMQQIGAVTLPTGR
jgi:steroid delta-isomerase-like uncharacterized protein